MLDNDYDTCSNMDDKKLPYFKPLMCQLECQAVTQGGSPPYILESDGGVYDS